MSQPITTGVRGDLNAHVQEAANAEDLCIGAKVMPIWTVRRRIGEYPKWKIAEGQLLKALGSGRQPASAFPRVTRRYELDSYTCIDNRIEQPVDAVEQADLEDYLDLEVFSAKQLGINALLDHERRVRAKIFDTSVFDATNSVVAYTQSNLETVDAIRDIQGRIRRLENLGVIANTIVLSSAVADFITRTALFQNYVKGYGVISQGAIPDTSTILRAFESKGIKQVLVGRVGVDESKNRKAADVNQVWTNDYIWVGRSQLDGNGAPWSTNRAVSPYSGDGAAYTIAWDKFGSGDPTSVEVYEEKEVDSAIIRAGAITAEKVVDPTKGALVTTQSNF